jgi:hypothetical protein
MLSITWLMLNQVSWRLQKIILKFSVPIDHFRRLFVIGYQLLGGKAHHLEFSQSSVLELFGGLKIAHECTRISLIINSF